MPGRILLGLAFTIAAALSGAPSSASAGVNALRAPEATPRAGSVDTTFTIGVGYVGAFPAVAVHAGVAGRTLPMTLVSGTALDGRWSVSTKLPAGTWTVTFGAVASKGNDPSMSGPVITVASAVDAATPRPTPAASVSATQPRPSAGGDRGKNDGAATPGSATPGSATAAAVASGSPAADDPAASPSPTAAAAEFTDRATGPTPSATPGAAAASASRASPATAVRATAPAGASTSPETSEEPGAPIVPVGAALLALTGLGWIAVARRRRTRDRADAPATDPGSRSDAEAEITATLHRRTLRRARVRLEEDPIIASIGMPEQEPPRPRRRKRPT